MQLIGTLASGIIGAEGGRAVILKRGSTRRARYYSDFEGTAAIDGSDVDLDANGGAVIYVNITVDVLVYGANDQLIRRWTESSTAACVEVISPSFTGADYETGQGGANKPTTLKAALDRLLVSFGAEDFKVLMPDGSKRTLRSAIASVTGVFFNVKSPLFGAIGDGVANDAAAIQAAIDAAQAAGGGTVFIPAGTFLLGTTQLTIPDVVSVLGAGANASVIQSAKIDGPGVAIGEGGLGIQTITGVRFFAATTGAQELVTISENAKVSFRCCEFNCDSATDYGVTIESWASGSAAQVSFEDCDFNCEGAFGAIESLLDPREGRVDIRRCRFTITANFSDTNVVKGACLHLYGCAFDNSLAASGTYSCIEAYGAGGTYGSVRCCEFINSDGATVTCMDVGTMSAAGEWFTEDGNILATASSNLSLYAGSFSGNTNYYCKLGTRESRVREIDSTTTTVALDALDEHGIMSISSTFAGNCTLTADSASGSPIGARLRVLFVNNDASTRTLIIGTNMRGGTFTIGANQCIGLEFVRAIANNGSGDVSLWFLVGSSGPRLTGSVSSYTV